MKTYTKYPLAQLGEVGKFQSGVGFPKRLQGKASGDLPFAKVGDISRFARSGESFLGPTENYVDYSDLAELRATPLPKGTIIFAKIGEAIRQGFRLMTTAECLVDNNVMGYIPDSRRLHDRYAFHFLRTCDFYRLASKTVVPALRKSVLEAIDIPLPPLPEQRRIAAILDKADELRAKRRTAIEKLDRLAESIFLEMFGDFRRDPHRWQVVKFADVVRETKLGLVRSSLQIRPDAPYPYVRMDAITTSGRLDLGNVLRTTATDSEIEEYHVRPGDLLFNTRNSKELVGKTAVFRSKGLFLFNNNLLRITLNEKAHPEYVAAAMRTPFVRRELNLRKSGTTSVFAIYYKDLRTLPLPLPPKALQEEFADKVNAVEKTRLVYERSLESVDELFSSLQQRAFRGELSSESLRVS